MATLPKADIAQSIESTLILVQLVAPKVGRSIGKRLTQGDSPEAILDEIIESARQTPENQGLAHLLSAVRYLRNDQIDDALNACMEARRASPALSPAVRYIEGLLLTLQGRWDESFDSLEESYRGLWPAVIAVEAAPYLSLSIEQFKKDFYYRWTIPGIFQGMAGLIDFNVEDLERGGEKVVSVLRRAREDGQEEAVWEAMSKAEASLPPGSRRQMQEFREFVKLMAIEDPFERLRAVAKGISEVWPKDVDCVEAIREQRR